MKFYIFELTPTQREFVISLLKQQPPSQLVEDTLSELETAEMIGDDDEDLA